MIKPLKNIGPELVYIKVKVCVCEKVKLIGFSLCRGDPKKNKLNSPIVVLAILIKINFPIQSSPNNVFAIRVVSYGKNDQSKYLFAFFNLNSFLVPSKISLS